MLTYLALTVCKWLIGFVIVYVVLTALRNLLIIFFEPPCYNEYCDPETGNECLNCLRSGKYRK